MTRCVIHIGMHKTGSTSIQQSLEGFSDDRFLYAKLDIANHSLAMHSLFAPQPERHRLHLAQGRDRAAVAAYAARMRAALEQSIAQAGERTLLVSGEDICFIRSEGLEQMRDHLLARCDALEIVGYVRAPGGFMASSFQQRVRANAAAGFAPARDFKGYRRRFAKFDQVFGPQRVRLWKYDPAKFRGGCVVRDFCARLGIALPRARIVRLNDSLPRQAVAMLYAYGKLAPACGFAPLQALEAERLGAALAALGGDRFRISPSAIQPVLREHREDIAWMEARLGCPLDEDLGAPRAGDVADESDLLRPDPAAAGKLRAQLGEAAPAGVAGETPEEVARLVHALRRRLAGPDVKLEAQQHGSRAGQARRPRAGIRVAELVEQLRRSQPALLEGIPEEKAVALVRYAFRHVGSTLAAAGEGAVSFSALGRFQLRHTPGKAEGKSGRRTRIGFRPARRRAAR